MPSRLVVGTALLFALTSCGEETETMAEEPPPPVSAPLSPNDVSILYPLPPPAQRTELLAPSSAGPRGELLPLAVYGALPRLLTFAENADTLAELRVVSVRLDPCFPTLDRAAREAGGCMPQVRMVLQPLTLADRDGQTLLVSADAAIHTFYELSDDELDLLLRRVVFASREAQAPSADEPLGAHPVLAAQGLTGPFATALRQALLDHCGDRNLVRVTFMTSESFGDTWRFGGFDLQNGALVPMQVATLESADQVFLNLDLEGQVFDAGAASPAATVSDDISLFFDSDFATQTGPAATAMAYQSLLRIEDPRRYRPDTLDCVSCHVAPAARRWADVALTLAGPFEEYLDESSARVPGATVERTDELRAFGYFEDRPGISQRTANETHAVIRYLEAERGITR